MAGGLCCLALARLLSGNVIDHPPGVLVAQAPVQQATDLPSFSIGAYRLQPRARYDIAARVLAVQPYSADIGAKLSPLDLAVGWGPMSDSAVLEHFRIQQADRYVTLYPDEQAIDLRSALRGSANMHLIPADSQLRRQLQQVRPGHLVRMSGLLVNVSGPDGYRWKTSLTRLDSGEGACELFYVESLQFFDAAPPLS